MLRKARILKELVHRSLPDKLASLHAVVVLRAREYAPVAGLPDLEAVSRPRLIRGADRVRVETGPVSDVSRSRPAITEVNGDGIAGLARQYPNRTTDRAAAVAQLSHLFVREAESLGRGRAHEDGIVPRQLRQGFWQLLKPAVIREPPVPDSRVGPEKDLQSRPAFPRGRRKPEVFPQRERTGRQGGSDYYSAVKRLAPGFLEALRAHLRLPVFLDDVVTLALRFSGECREDLVRRFAAVQRRDERLDDRDRTVKRPRIAPGL